MKVLFSIGLVSLCLAAQSVQADPHLVEQPRFILMVTPKRADAPPARVTEEKESLLPRSPAMKILLEQALAGQSLQAPGRPPADAAVPMVIDLKKGLRLDGARHPSAPAPAPDKLPAAAEVKHQPPPRFAIEAKDETLSRALLRWSANGGHRLVWDAGVDFPVRDATYAASELKQAIDLVMADTQRSGYPLHACWHADQVIRILHVSQACHRP